MKVKAPNIQALQLQQNINDKHFYNTEGVKKADECKFDEAIEYFSKAINIAPEDALSYFNRATVKMETGNISGARSDFKLAESCQLNIIHIAKLGMN